MQLLRARIWLSSSMWVPVLTANVVAIGLALALPALDESLSDGGLLKLDLSSAEQIFGAIAAGMITFTGIVFSAVLVAAQIQTGSYSPRLAARLRRDRVVILALALPTATASYSLFALAALGHVAEHNDVETAPAITVLTGLLLTFATFAAFVALVQRTFDSTQIGGILRGLLQRSLQVAEQAHPLRTGPRDAVAVPMVEGPGRELRHTGTPGVVASVDRTALIRLAGQTGAFVEVVPVVGQYMRTGALALRLRNAANDPDPELAERVLVLARQRTLDQDPAFGMRIFVDIAIRGLSPAVNDPTTAVQAIDRVEAMLVDLHGRDLGPTVVAGAGGEPVGLIPAPTWEEYLDLALIEIRHYGAGSPQIARRLTALHAHLLEIVDEAERPRIELEQALLADSLVTAFPDPRERAILSRPDPLGLGAAP
jgi:uncharacterized membrane protein